jgi:hypothetical protein
MLARPDLPALKEMLAMSAQLVHKEFKVNRVFKA